MKKKYVAPAMQVVKIQAPQLLQSSVSDFSGPAGMPFMGLPVIEEEPVPLITDFEF